MAQKVLVNIDLGGNHLLNVRAEVLTGNPTPLGAGHFYWNSATEELRVYSGAAWIALGGGGGAGDMLAATYDPGGVGDDAFDMENMTEGATKKILTAAERTKLTNIEANADVTDATNVAAAGAQMTSEKGQANGYAELDGTGTVPASQLPSYVDDVLEAANQGAFPGTGETGKLYVALDTNKVYRWTGSVYVEISDAPDAATIKSLYESNADTNEFSDAEKTKLAAATTKYTETIGDGAATSIAVTHNLGTLDVIVSVREAAGGAVVLCDVVHTSTNVVTLGFASAPATDALDVVVIG